MWCGGLSGGCWATLKRRMITTAVTVAVIAVITVGRLWWGRLWGGEAAAHLMTLARSHPPPSSSDPRGEGGDEGRVRMMERMGGGVIGGEEEDDEKEEEGEYGVLDEMGSPTSSFMLNPNQRGEDGATQTRISRLWRAF